MTSLKSATKQRGFNINYRITTKPFQWLEIRLKAFRRSTIPQKQFIIVIIIIPLKYLTIVSTLTCICSETLWFQ